MALYLGSKKVSVNICNRTGGVDTSDATASADEIMAGETAYVNGEKVTGTFTIDNELNIQDDLIAQIQSVVDNLPEAGESTEPTLQSKTITPSTNSQIVTADSGYDGLDTVTVNGDANLIPANIVSGVSIFGIAGIASGGGSIETVTGTVGASFPPMPGRPLSGTVHYVNANGAYATSNIIGTIIVMKDSILYASSGDGVNARGDLVNLSGIGESKAYRVIGDFTVEI